VLHCSVLELARVLPNVANSSTNAEHVINSPLKRIRANTKRHAASLFHWLWIFLWHSLRRSLHGESYLLFLRDSGRWRRILFPTDHWLENCDESLDLPLACTQLLEFRGNLAQFRTSCLKREPINFLMTFRVHALSRRVV